MPVGAILELNEESDPRSLRNEFQQYRAGRFSWDARNHGSGRWTIRLERIDERADTPTFLSHCPPFASAKQSTIAELAALATERSYRSGETIFDEGELWPYLAFVRSGKVVYTLLSPDGKTHALGERLTHDSINESGTFDQGWVAWFCKQAAAQAENPEAPEFTIAGNGKQVRDVLNADDVTDLYFTALEKIGAAAGSVFNIGGGMANSLSLLELFALLEEQPGIRLRYRVSSPRAGDQLVFVADNRRVTTLTGWSPKIGFREGIGRMAFRQLS